MNKKRNLLLTLLVVVLIFSVNLLTADIFNGIANNYLVEFLSRFKCAVLAVLGAIILKRTWIYKRFDRGLLKKGWTAGIFEFFVALFMVIGFLGSGKGITAGPFEILLLVLELICVGIHEETLFRGLMQNAFHEFFGEDTVGHVILAVVCAGLCFGAIHLTNALRPGISLGDAAMQAVAAAGSGIFFGAVYFRTGKNLWYSMFLHVLHDAGVFLAQGALSGADTSAIISQASQGNSLPMLIGQTAVYTAVGLFVLRKKKVEPLLKKAEEV